MEDPEMVVPMRRATLAPAETTAPAQPGSEPGGDSPDPAPADEPTPPAIAVPQVIATDLVYPSGIVTLGNSVYVIERSYPAPDRQTVAHPFGWKHPG